MIKVGVKISGLKTLEGQFETLEKLASTEPLKAVAAAAYAIQSNAIKNIRQNTDGTPQQRYRPKRIAFASQPFEFPNSDTGVLVGSIQVEIIDSLKNPTALVGSNHEYAKFLEFGTRNMAPRPWLGLAAQNEADTIKKHFQAVSKDLVKGMQHSPKRG